MKTSLIILLSLILFSASATPQLTEDQKLESLAKVWGFLKYYHPEVAKGKIDWDADLFVKIKEVKRAKTKQDLNQVYESWLDQLGKVKPCKKCDNNVPDSLKRNLDLAWIADSSIFTPNLSKQLAYIRDNRNQGKNYYVQPRYPFLKVQAYFKNEKAYTHLEHFPSQEYRLLGLFRYWNIINYFFPYKYATGEKWEQVLTDMLPKFRDATSPGNYHLAMLELTTRINDGHSTFRTKYVEQFFGRYYFPFYLKIIDGKAVVQGLYHEGFAKADGINQGDVITKIDGLPVLISLAEKLKYVSASNYNYKLATAPHHIFNGTSGAPVKVTVEREGMEHELSVKRYPFSRFGYQRKVETSATPWQMLTNDIGYINIGPLKRNDVKAAMKEVWNTKGLIVDLREYPRPGTPGAMANYLLPDKLNPATISYPDLKYPGVFRPKAGPLKYGRKNNRNYYKGKVVLLVDEGTMSTGEFTTMALQFAPKVTTIGSQTAGADGNVVKIVFPGGYVTTMSGLGFYYPDGRETQRVGVDVDIEVRPTIKGIQQGEDEILNRAVEYLRSGNQQYE